jgi:hypothetical protein
LRSSSALETLALARLGLGIAAALPGALLSLLRSVLPDIVLAALGLVLNAKLRCISPTGAPEDTGNTWPMTAPERNLESN